MAANLRTEGEEATREPQWWRLISMQDVQHLVSETLNTPETLSFRPEYLAVHECPMGDGNEYIIWVYCLPSSKHSQRGKTPPDGGARCFVYKYRLRLPSGRSDNGDQPSMQLLLVNGAQRERPVEVDATYAGHTEMLDWATHRRRILALAELHLTDEVDEVAKQGHKVAMTRQYP